MVNYRQTWNGFEIPIISVKVKGNETINLQNPMQM